MEELKKFEISGNFRMKDKMQKFTKTIGANNEKHAREIVLATIGSKHKTPRRMIKIDSIKAAGE